jgi:hypothetical protein
MYCFHVAAFAFMILKLCDDVEKKSVVVSLLSGVVWEQHHEIA